MLPLPQSTATRAGDAPLDDVCLSVPCIVNRGGVEQPLPIPMNDAELAGLGNSAETIRATVRGLGL